MSFGGQVDTEINKQIVNSDSFYPAIDLNHFQQVERLPAEYSMALLESLITIALLEINNDLTRIQKVWLDNGQVGLTLDQQALYFRAVYARAKAYAIKEFKTVVNRVAANNAGKEDDDQYNKFLKLSSNAVRLLQNRRRITTVLI